MSKLIDQLKRHEGIRLKPYRCTAGVLSIGYGRSLETKGITLYEAEILLNHDVGAVVSSLKNELIFWERLDHVRQEALINMAFNIGVTGLMKFKKTLSMIAGGDYLDASIEMLDSKWAIQVPKRAKELSEQMETGRYQ